MDINSSVLILLEQFCYADVLGAHDGDVHVLVNARHMLKN